MKANHTVCVWPEQNGSSNAVVAFVTFWLVVKGMEGMTVGALKSSLGGGTGMTEISVTATPVLPERLSPWKVTKKSPTWLLDGIQLKVPVLSPLSTKLAPGRHSAGRERHVARLRIGSGDREMHVLVLQHRQMAWRLTDTFGCALKRISPVIGVVSASQNCSKVASKETTPLAHRPLPAP